MLTSGFAEGQEARREITIGNTTPEAFKALLRYLYTDELQFPDEHLMEVMHKAKEIQLDRVYEYAVRRASRLLSVHNVVEWLVKADEYGMEELRKAALTFFNRNLQRISQRPDGRCKGSQRDPS
uniref:BTB domain-containing protein n=1 Tax=Chromera velia CCMP2878 TaxID=1169474 RepID=A0A0G4HJQ8_9ALVE|eukprot:Cvel_28219.t1-p1 / transcript=Cvel_28219.t1 / gene=Cvel_28219 / organism=Chromera_velia_CCMP2878 / gene_product=Speckle-type POZ protein-like, putative / transcript_product=Speckle-type POZ protein-like, putative / location=Cvel_scaffold3653:12013-12381(-) / protein_length=123 / sequence_SO=supercontig / SO=protein_coding / is_pseudo=false